MGKPNDNLRRALEAKGIETEVDRARFAYGVGVTERTLRRWLNGDTDPQPFWRKRVAERLRVSEDELWPAKEAA